MSPRGERQDPERDRNGEGDDDDGQAKESPCAPLPLSARRLWIVFRLHRHSRLPSPLQSLALQTATGFLHFTQWFEIANSLELLAMTGAG